MLRRYRIRDYDFKLVIMLIALTTIGVLAVTSADASYQQKQIMGFVMGFFLMVVISLFDYSFFLRFYWLLYIGNVFLLALVPIFGRTVGGAKRWVILFGIQFQPSELAKILLILFYAQYIMKHKEHFNTLKNLVTMVLLLIPPLLLIYKQPNLSTSIIIVIIFCMLVFIGGIHYKILISIFAITVPVLIILLTLVLQPDQDIIKPYQQTRILAWLQPEEYENEEGYQQENSRIAIGSGQLYGKGLNNNEIGSVNNGNFISEPQTDFIFAIIGEELGFVGGSIVILLVAFITLECIFIAKRSKDLAGTLIASGMATLIGFQSFINMAVATGVMPNTGIPFPFVSYGLTSLVSVYIGMGFVLNVKLQGIKKYS